MQRVQQPCVDPLWGSEIAGTYRIERTLGGGAMGKVYEASHLRIDRRYAIKVMRESHAENSTASKRFLLEACALGTIRSPYILDVFDVVTLADGRPCLVSELLEGEDLQARLNRQRTLPAAEALNIVRQACIGLQAAHGRGVVHRDLKPSNLFLLRQPQNDVAVKVVDFGVAKLWSTDQASITESGAMLGTPAYMSPEQACDPSSADVRSDVYALGAVLYRAMTGRAPYVSNDPRTTISRLLRDDPPRPRALDHNISLDVEAIIQRAMARQMAARYASVAAMQADVEAALCSESRVGHKDRAARLPNSQRAKHARPCSIAWLTAASLLGAACSAILLRTLADTWRGPSPATFAERALLALGVCAGWTLLVLRLSAMLRRRWTSAPSIEHAGAICRAISLTVGFSFGALLLVKLGYAALSQASSIVVPLSALRWATIASVASGLWSLRRRLRAAPALRPSIRRAVSMARSASGDLHQPS